MIGFGGEDRGIIARSGRDPPEILAQARACEPQIDRLRMALDEQVERVQRIELNGAATRDADRERGAIDERGRSLASPAFAFDGGFGVRRARLEAHGRFARADRFDRAAAAREDRYQPHAVGAVDDHFEPRFARRDALRDLRDRNHIGATARRVPPVPRGATVDGQRRAERDVGRVRRSAAVRRAAIVC